MDENLPPLLVIVGQTAVGKTALSLRLAELFNGEIVSADSRLFYRGMDIGTAKPSAAEQTAVSHHLIDICDPDETVTLGDYQRLAYRTIDGIAANGRLPILVGGTGQYVKAVVEGWGIPKVPPHSALRAALEQMDGGELVRWIKALDPVAAARLDLRNLRRVIRALEVTLVAGVPISVLQKKSLPAYRIGMIGLARERSALYARIDARVDRMMVNGLLDEVKGLREEGYGRLLPSMSGLGYRQLWAYLDGEMTLDEAVERIKFETHRFSRQQNTWFRRDDPRIVWFDMGEVGVETAVINYVQQWMDDKFSGAVA
ncbi:MAG: tRNA (adenosine(37)-N6)-dimethylallyltransferase MiaA [Anaerolineales bacterium]|nr:tRNA (adenosine(37)-N6)-dimethylallyltransferase MiaA [Anaerolineales bacterium]